MSSTIKCPTCKQNKSYHLIRFGYDANNKVTCQCAVCWGLPQELEEIFLNAALAIEKGADEIWAFLGTII